MFGHALCKFASELENSATIFLMLYVCYTVLTRGLMGGQILLCTQSKMWVTFNGNDAEQIELDYTQVQELGVLLTSHILRVHYVSVDITISCVTFFVTLIISTGHTISASVWILIPFATVKHFSEIGLVFFWLGIECKDHQDLCQWDFFFVCNLSEKWLIQEF